MPYTKKNRKRLHGGSQRQLNIALRKARQQQEQRERRQAAAAAAAASGNNDFEKININVPQDTYTNPSRGQKIMSSIYRLPSFLKRSKSKSKSYNVRTPSMPEQPVSNGMTQNNIDMVRRMQGRLQQYKRTQNSIDRSMNAISNHYKKPSKQTHVYPPNLAGEILKSNPTDKALFVMYCQQSLDNWRQFKADNGGVPGVKRMSDHALKEGMKRHVLMLSDIKHLRSMKVITEKHAPKHFLLKMLNYVLNNEGGSKVQFNQEIDDQEFANSIPDAGSQLFNNIPEAGSHKLVSQYANKSKTKSKKLTGPMSATGKRRTKRKGRKPKKSSQRK